MIEAGTAVDDPLSFDLPAWGERGSAGHVGLSDAVFLALFAASSVRLGLRRRVTIACLALSLVATIVVSVAFDRAMPLLSAAFLLANVDRLAALLRTKGAVG